MRPVELARRAARAAWATRPARAVTVAAAALLVLVAAVAAWPRAVPAFVAERRPLVQRVVASGRVMAPAKVGVASVAVGRVAEVAVREGDAVRPGQLLVRLDDAEARAALAQARGRVAEAAARLDQVRGVTGRTAAEAVRQAELEVGKAERDLERVRKLADAGAASAAQLDDAEKSVAVARSRAEAATVQAADAKGEGSEVRLAAATLRQAQGAEALARARLDETQLRARAPGRVLTRDVERSDVVSPGRVLLVVAEDGAVRLVVQPDEKNLAMLRVGQPAEAVADAFPDRPFRAAVSWIAPAVDAARGTVEVRLDVPEPPPFLRPDMTVSVNVEVGRRADALVVAAEAVRDAATEPWVLRIEGSRAVRRPVRLGLRGEGAVEVTSGIEAGDAVVAPAAAVAPGARVRAHAPGRGEPGRAL